MTEETIKGRILFVEDYADTRALIAYLLEGAGYRVTTCETLQEGLANAAAQPYDLFLLNHVLPDGSGITLCHLLRESHPVTPIIMFSAVAHPAEQQAGLEAGADEYLVKPNDLLDLPIVIGRLLESARIRRESGLTRLMAVWAEQTHSDANVHFAQTTRQFAELFQGLPVACFIFDNQGCIIEWNRASELLYGRRTADVFLQPVVEIIHCRTEQDFMAKLLVQVLDGSVVEGEEISIERPDGQRREVLCNAFPLHSPQGEVLGGINASMDITRRKQQEEQLKQLNVRLLGLAMSDGLTGLKNHRAFKERLAEEFTRAGRYETPLSLILLDVDRFKDYNDAFGHPAGDEILIAVARRMQETARDSDVVARYGGEEFAILLPHTDEEASIVFAERLRTAIEQADWPQRSITASLGVATFIAEMKEGADLIAAADRALYTSKANGRNRTTHMRELPEQQSH